jgi:molecular chaperone DnaK (HSP70)
MTSDLIKRTTEKCALELSDAGLNREAFGKVILVGRQTRMPAIHRAVAEFFAKEPSQDVDPVEAVALGAAIQASVLAGETKGILLLDVIPSSLGVETLGGVCSRLIERNTTIPTKKSQIFSTARNNQPDVLIRILQGEREMAADNKTIGTLHLIGIPPAPKGIPQIEVTFDIWADGVLYIAAKDLGTEEEVKTKIEDRGTLIEPAQNVCAYGRWPGETSPTKEAKLFYNEAVEMLQQNDCCAAIKKLKKSIELNRNFAHGHQTLSEIYNKKASEPTISFIKRMWFRHLATSHLEKANRIESKQVDR